MIKVINERTYNTETAMAIAFYECSNNRTSRYYYSEQLYITDNGEFFLHGTGGLFAPYGTVDQNGIKHPGEDIVVLTAEKAKRWADIHSGSGLLIEPNFAFVIETLKL